MLTQHCTDEELLRRAQQRDRSAFAELVHRYLPRIYLLTVSAMGDPGVATDVVCDAMTSAVDDIDAAPGGCSPRSWLMGHALRAAVARLSGGTAKYSVRTLDGRLHDRRT